MPGRDDYRFFESNPGANLLWELAMAGGTSVLDLDSYGLEPGAPANGVCVDAPTSEWAILGGADVKFVVSKGRSSRTALSSVPFETNSRSVWVPR